MRGSKDGMNAIGLGHVTRLTIGHATRTHFLLEAIPSFDTPLPLKISPHFRHFQHFQHFLPEGNHEIVVIARPILICRL
ncbi:MULTISPECIES: hypothetical protein [unclassified Moorena]|uniref:hypothetical protein n=1 Tax=unclassified Moorena TaxID=2683338 RepID=UPI0013FC0DFC|nr:MULTISPECIES: hypothetical protein [unclassified Moorena]NEO15290.1 hypothetical protein [Moorena sp. SIO3E8]NEP29149.1 hypothetical protein [Moorena sp. SIO3I6]NEQ01625.1 hypothetical protein [Moorena sp. SIO3F7]